MPRVKRTSVTEEPIITATEEVPVVEETKKKKEEKTGTVTAFLNVRKTPGGEIVKILKEGDVVKILGEESDWYKIEDGYVKKKYIK